MASLSSSICEPGSPSPAVGGNFPGKNVERALGLTSRVGKAAGMLALVLHAKLAPQSHDLSARSMPGSLLQPTSFRLPL